MNKEDFGRFGCSLTANVIEFHPDAIPMPDTLLICMTRGERHIADELRKGFGGFERVIIDAEHVLVVQFEHDNEELTAERDEWKTKCETREIAYKQADAERKRYSEQIDKLTAERDELRETINGIEHGQEMLDLRSHIHERDKQIAELETYRKYADQGECEKPQSEENGDTREQLEVDVERMVKEHSLYWLRTYIIEWLDRQAAITKRKCYESEAWRLGITRDAIECGETVGIFGREYVPADLAEELKADRDRLQEALDEAEDACESCNRACEACQAAFAKENEVLREAIDAMELGQFYSMYRRKFYECERLKRKLERGGSDDEG